MPNAIQSVLGMFKSLLPLGSGDTLPVVPKLPDFSAFLDNMMAMLQGILGTTPDLAPPQAPPPPPATPAPSNSSAPVTIPPVVNPSSMALLKSGSSNPSAAGSKPDNPASAAPPAPANFSSTTLSSAALSAQIQQIRGIVERIQKDTPGDPSAQTAPPKQALNDLAQALVELKKQILAASQGSIQPGTAPASAAASGSAPVPPPVPAAAVAAPPAASGLGLSVLALSSKSAGGDALSLPSSQTPLSTPFPLGAAPKDAASFDTTLDLAASQMRGLGDDALSAIPQAASLPLVAAMAGESAAATEAPLVSKSDLALPGAAAPGRSAADRPSGPAMASGTAEAPTPEERAEFIEELVKAARLTQSRGNARIKLDLNPPNLGTLKMDLSVRQHVLSGTFQADNSAAGEMLLSHLPSLRQSLESQGIQVGDFQVQVNQSFQQAPQNGSDGRTSRKESLEAKGGSEVPSIQAQDRIRSVRLQMIDYVA